MIPRIQIQTVKGQIGIRSHWGQVEVQTRYADLYTKQKPADMEVYTPPATMEIDLRKSNNAISGGKLMDFTRRIYSQMPGIALKNMARIVERGNRMAAIHLPGNAIAELAKASLTESPPRPRIFGPASWDNVDIHIDRREVQVDIQPNYTELTVITHDPKINFHRGSVEIYLKQRPSIKIIPPELDMRI